MSNEHGQGQGQEQGQEQGRVDYGLSTCGSLFAHAARETILDKRQHSLNMFAAGFLAGLAEKVYIGACRAAMVRPPESDRTAVLGYAVTLSAIYGLEVSIFNKPGLHGEIWLHAREAHDDVAELSQMKVNSPEWHFHRAKLCGVRAESIDLKYHERYRMGETPHGVRDAVFSTPKSGEPREGQWYWVKSAGGDWFPAQYSSFRGWTNNDTWEDSLCEIVEWLIIPPPEEEQQT